MPPPPLRDSKGCLTAAGLAALRRAAPGQAPTEIAAHLASCPRCQDRLLGADLDSMKSRGAPRQPPPFWRILVLFAVGFVLALFAFVWVRRALGGGME